jgi:transposase-like protein
VAEPAREVRWSARRKADAVMRLLRGEDLEELSRELRVEAHRLAAWRDDFMAGGSRARGAAVDAGGSKAQGGRTQDRSAHHGNEILKAVARRGLHIPPRKRPR